MFKKLVLLFILVLAIASDGFSQTILNPGKIRIIAMITDGNDEFSFVLLTSITS